MYRVLCCIVDNYLSGSNRAKEVIQVILDRNTGMRRNIIGSIFSSKEMYEEITDALYFENQKHISISGVQIKYSLLLKKNKLHLTKAEEKGTHILKPIPSGVKNADQLPANEHLTMQIAQQIFGIETASNAMIFFKDGKKIKRAPGLRLKQVLLKMVLE